MNLDYQLLIEREATVRQERLREAERARRLAALEHLAQPRAALPRRRAVAGLVGVILGAGALLLGGDAIGILP